MAVTKELVSRKIIIATQVGETASGGAKLGNRTFNNINPDATDAQMHAVAAAIGGLMENGAAAIYFDDKSLLESTTQE